MSSAFNAIISSSVVLLDLAYGIPIAINVMRGRNTLPERAFVLPHAVGWILNIVRAPKSCQMDILTLYQISLAYIILTTVLFLFPPELPVTGPNMSKLPDLSYP